MKKLLVLFFLYSLCISAQETSGVQKSLFGIQTGLYGIWGHNEYRLADEFILRSEVGLNYSSGIDNLDDGSVVVLYPNVALSSRYYYNLQKRQKLEKNTYNNASDYLELKVTYIPDWFTISNSDQEFTRSEKTMINLLWGIKRNVGKHFSYEAGAGLRYSIEYLKKYGLEDNSYDINWDLHLRVGYSF